MRQRITLDEESVPRLPRHIRLDRMGAGGGARELDRLLRPDSLALEVLRRCDGRASVGAIVDEVSAKFAAPREAIASGVTALLQDLADEGFLTA